MPVKLRVVVPVVALAAGTGILMWKLRRNIGAVIVRANALLLMDRVVSPALDRVARIGDDAAAAFSRQSSVHFFGTDQYLRPKKYLTRAP